MRFRENLRYLSFPWVLSIPLLVAAFALSVFFRGTDSFLFAPGIVCALGFAALSLYSNFPNSWAVPKTATAVFILAFWVMVFISQFWSTIPYISTLFTLILSLLPGLFFVYVLAPRPKEWVEVHGFVMGLIACGFAVWALVQYLFFYDVYGPRIHHPMLNPNNLAGLLNMALFPALGMFLLSRRVLFQVLCGLAVAALYAAIIATQSRGGVLAAGIAALVLLPFVWPSSGRWGWKLVLILILAAVMPFVMNLFHPGAISENLGQLSQTLGLGNKVSVTDRFLLWQSGWQMAKDHFWTGTGLATFFFYYPAYRSPVDASDGFFVHMDPLQFFIEMGVLAPVLFYVVLLCILARTIRAVIEAGADTETKIRVIGPFAGMLALVLHTHISFHLYMPGILIPLATLLAYWYVQTETVLKGERFEFSPPRYARILIAGVALAAFIIVSGWTARAGAAVYLLGKTRSSFQAGDYAEALRYVGLMDRIAPSKNYHVPEYQARIRLEQLVKGGSDREALFNLYREIHAYLDEAERRHPRFTAIWQLRARLYYSVHGVFEQDGFGKAEVLLKKSLKIDPYQRAPRIGLAQIYERQGKNDEARVILEEQLEWIPLSRMGDMGYLQELAKYRKRDGDEEGLQEVLKQVQIAIKMQQQRQKKR